MTCSPQGRVRGARRITPRLAIAMTSRPARRAGPASTQNLSADRELQEISGAVSIRGGAGRRLDKGDNAMDTTLDSIRTASPATATTARRRWPGRVLSG